MHPKNEILKKAHSDLRLIGELLFKHLGYETKILKIEDESVDYGAAECEVNQHRIKFRTGKITPTKIGQFVTFWKRIGKGPILPYDLIDPFDFLIVSVRASNRFGLFVFPKTVLGEKGIISTKRHEGKRAMRIYPPWDKTENAQSKKTQAWQIPYFLEISDNQDMDLMRIKNLLTVY